MATTVPAIKQEHAANRSADVSQDTAGYHDADESEPRSQRRILHISDCVRISTVDSDLVAPLKPIHHNSQPITTPSMSIKTSESRPPRAGTRV